MCDLCDDAIDGVATCPDCGRIICFDIEGIDDVSAPAYVTLSGDVFCVQCGSGYDNRAEEQEEYDDFMNGVDGVGDWNWDEDGVHVYD